jgi:hypothetical protein
MKKTIIFIAIFVLIFNAGAQTSMGGWRTHLAYNSVNQIVQSENNIFAISDGSLFSVSKDDGDKIYYSKMSGLSDAGISKIDYDDVNKQLLIIYKNGNIDIMHQAGVNNIPDLRNKQMSASKAINHTFFSGDFALLSADFGIVRINMSKKEISDTYIIGPNATEIKILSTTIRENKIYAAGTSTIYTADASNPNLVNYEFWTPMTGLPGSGNFQQVFSFQDKLFVLRNGKLYYQQNNTWTALLSAVNITNLNVTSNRLMASDGTSVVYVLNAALEVTPVTMINSPDIEYDAERDTYWLAALSQGVASAKIIAGNQSEITYYKTEGPAVNIPWDMTFAGKRMFMVNGGRWAVSSGRSGYVMIYENGVWKNLSGLDITPKTGYSALDFMNVAANPKDSTHFYVTSYGTGLYEFKNDEFFQAHNHLNTNGIIETLVASNPFNYTRLDGAIFDKDENLLMISMKTSNLVKIRAKDGTWKQLNYPSGSLETLGKIVINNQNPNQKWVQSLRGTPGVFVWDDNGTYDVAGDDKSRFISRFEDSDNPGSYLNPSFFFCLTQDKNGVFWAGTDIGPLLFYNTSKAFDENYTCSRVKIPRNDGTGLADYLLQNERIRSMAIDGANRKWLGTESSGLYLMSENGQETIHHFTSSNSPLLSNNIMSLAINPITGEVMIGTSNGLVSFQSDAADGTKTYNNVYAYPNPVKENYNGVITITGLIENTQVKITDLNGNLLYQTISNGSIATWDGKNIHGEKVSTGIYLAICVNEEGTQSTITKIMVIN